MLLGDNPQITEKEIRKAGGGPLALVLVVKDKRRMNLRSLVKDLNRSFSRGVNVIAVSMPAADGPAWKVISLYYLRELADELSFVRQQLFLEAALKRSG